MQLRLNYNLSVQYYVCIQYIRYVFHEFLRCSLLALVEALSVDLRVVEPDVDLSALIVVHHLVELIEVLVVVLAVEVVQLGLFRLVAVEEHAFGRGRKLRVGGAAAVVVHDAAQIFVFGVGALAEGLLAAVGQTGEHVFFHFCL